MSNLRPTTRQRGGRLSRLTDERRDVVFGERLKGMKGMAASTQPENRPEALPVGEPGENTRYSPALRGGGWGENCHRGWRDLTFARTG